MATTVQKMYEAMGELVKRGKGDYELFCEGGFCAIVVEEACVHDEVKTICF